MRLCTHAHSNLFHNLCCSQGESCIWLYRLETAWSLCLPLSIILSRHSNFGGCFRELIPKSTGNCCDSYAGRRSRSIMPILFCDMICLSVHALQRFVVLGVCLTSSSPVSLMRFVYLVFKKLSMNRHILMPVFIFVHICPWNSY